MKSEHENILQALQTYAESIYHGDVERLLSVFHPRAALFGEVKGAPYYKSLEEYLASVAQRQSPQALGEELRIRPLAIETQGPIAMARMSSPILGFNYIDYLSLVRVEGK
jgi:Putative lumazine-binding